MPHSRAQHPHFCPSRAQFCANRLDFISESSHNIHIPDCPIHQSIRGTLVSASANLRYLGPLMHSPPLYALDFTTSNNTRCHSICSLTIFDQVRGLEIIIPWSLSPLTLSNLIQTPRRCRLSSKTSTFIHGCASRTRLSSHSPPTRLFAISAPRMIIEQKLLLSTIVVCIIQVGGAKFMGSIDGGGSQCGQSRMYPLAARAIQVYLPRFSGRGCARCGRMR